MRARAIRRGAEPRSDAATVTGAVRPSVAALVFLRGRDADGRLRELVAERAQVRPVLGALAAALLGRARLRAAGLSLPGRLEPRAPRGGRAGRARVGAGVAGSRGAAVAAGSRACGRGLLERGAPDRGRRHPGERGRLPRDGARAHAAGGEGAAAGGGFSRREPGARTARGAGCRARGLLASRGDEVGGGAGAGASHGRRGAGRLAGAASRSALGGWRLRGARAAYSVARARAGAARSPGGSSRGATAMLRAHFEAGTDCAWHGGAAQRRRGVERDGSHPRFRCVHGSANLQSHTLPLGVRAGRGSEPTTLCAYHHHRGVHAGSLAIRGRAPDALVYRLGVGRFRSGDVMD